MSKKDWGIESAPEFWFNTRTHEVEVGPQSLSIDRIGPFETREQAEHGPEIVAERARRWAEEDEAEDA
ncbi:MAG: methionine aminopeptidase [Leucobacter sp.]|nr:methionine aminopeptidase [Leucobacter sp.]